MSKNYKINNKTKKVLIYNILSPVEEQALSLYIKQGYTIKVMEDNKDKSNKRLKQIDIINWFKENNNTDGLEKFKAEKERRIIDKNGNERDAGYLIAEKWFKTNYPDGYEAIKNSKKIK